MLAISPVPSNANIAATAPVPGASLALPPGASQSITYLAAAPTNADGGVINQRQPQVESTPRAALIIASQPPIASSAGLQPAALRSVTQEFGYSSPFMAQLIDQASGSALGNALNTPTYRNLTSASDSGTIKYLPSAAGVPVVIPPLLKLAQGSTPAAIQPQPQPAPPPVAAPTAGAVSFVAPADYLPVSNLSASVATQRSAATANDTATEPNALTGGRNVRARQANTAYQQAAQRMGQYKAPEAPEPTDAIQAPAPVPADNATAIEAVQAVA